MIRRWLYFPLWLLLFSYSLESVSQVRATREEVDSLIDIRGQAEVLIKYPGFNELTEIGKHLSISGVREGMAVIVIAPDDRDYFYDLQIPYYLYTEETGKSVISAATMADAMNWDKYPSYQQYDSIMRKLANDHPDICRLDTIGTSYQGRLVLALKISDNVSADEAEPEVFYTSTMHGDELAGYVLMLRLAQHLLVNYHSGSLEEKLIDSLEIWINPLANPDGTYRDPDSGSNRDTIYNPTRLNANGTDINRSFPVPVPNEPPDNETDNFISFQEKRKFVLSANFHAGAEVVNYPWDSWLSLYHADDTWFEKISRNYADTVHYYSGSGYLNDYNDGIVRGSEWYIIYGGRQDFITYAQQGREVTIELDITKQTPGAQLPLLWEYNYRSLLRYLENAIYGIHGIIADEDTGNPVRAKIFIAGHDSDSSHVYSDTITGGFARLLAPGTYNLVISSDGYQTKTIDNLVVFDRQQLWVNVKLKKLTQSIDPGLAGLLRIWPVPAGDYLNLQLDVEVSGESEITIISQSGHEVKKFTRQIYSGIPSPVNISNLAPGTYIIVVREPGAGNIISLPFIKR